MVTSRIQRRHIWIRNLSCDGSRGERHRYSIADRDVTSDVPVPFLAPVAEPLRQSVPDLPPSMDDWPGQPVLAGYLPLAGRDRHVYCGIGHRAYFLQFEAAGRWAVAADGSAIYCLDGGRPVGEAFYDVLLGPCVCLALALEDTWCLHASAITDGRHLAAFVGGSGRGKSTLADRFTSRDLHPWRRCADDVLPIEARTVGALALPRYPQLKLPDPARQAAKAPERQSLSAVYLLEHAVTAGPARVDEVVGAPAVAALVGHTHAARLFGPRLLARHLACCGRLASEVPIRRLTFERRLDRLDDVAQTVIDDLGRL